MLFARYYGGGGMDFRLPAKNPGGTEVGEVGVGMTLLLGGAGARGRLDNLNVDSCAERCLSAFRNLKTKKATGSARKHSRCQLCPGGAQRVVGARVVRACWSGCRPQAKKRGIKLIRTRRDSAVAMSFFCQPRALHVGYK